MKNSNKFGLTAVLLSLLLVGCSSAPIDDTTVIEDTSVQTVQVDTTIEDAAAAAGSVLARASWQQQWWLPQQHRGLWRLLQDTQDRGNVRREPASGSVMAIEYIISD